MDQDLTTLLTLLGQGDPGASKTPDLVGMYGGGGPSQGRGATIPQYGASSIVPNTASEKPKELGLFNKLPPGMLGKSPLDGYGMLGSTPYQR